MILRILSAIILLLSACGKVTVVQTGMDLRHASVHISKNKGINGLNRLPKWPVDSLQSKVLLNIGNDFYNKFISEFNRKTRTCNYRIVEHPDLADAVIELRFNAISMNGDTLILKSELQVSDRRTGRKESYNFETRSIKKNPITGKVTDETQFHIYGRLLNTAVKSFDSEGIIKKICP